MYVAVTQALRNEVGRRISQLQEQELNADPVPAVPVFPLAENEWLRRIVWPVLFGSEFEGHRELAHNNLTTVRLHITELDEARFGPDNSMKLKRSSSTTDMTVEVEGAAKYFYVYETYAVSRDAHPFFAQWADNRLLRVEIEHRWEFIGKKVDNFLEHCKSLNEALKLWPDLAHYIPKEALVKVAASAEKKKTGPSDAALKALKAINTDAVAQSNVLARMSGAASTSAANAQQEILA